MIAPRPALLLRGAPQAAPRPPAPSPGADPETGQGGGAVLVCRGCGHEITRSAERMAVDGGHRHVFSNPHGYVFELGCFRSAPGCAPHGTFSTDFTWFPGHAWQVALCGGCGALLGWRYRSAAGSGFYGLILPELRERED